MGLRSRHIINFSELGKADLEFVGKKAYQLSQLKSLGISIPDGFVITAAFYERFLELSGIKKKIKEIEKINHPAIAESVAKLYIPVKKKIITTPLPQSLAAEIYRSYKKMSTLFKESSLNIFSSSLGNSQMKFLNVKGDANLVFAIKKIWSHYFENPVNIVVEKNIKSKIKGKFITSDSLVNKNFSAIARKIQKHFYFPQDVDYAIEKGETYITAIRPSTPYPKKIKKILAQGIPLNTGIATGVARVLDKKNSEKIKNSDVVIASKFSLSLCQKLRKAKAVVLDMDIINNRDKMIYKKALRIPVVCNVKNAAKKISGGNIITVNGINGEIYSGGLI